MCWSLGGGHCQLFSITFWTSSQASRAMVLISALVSCGFSSASDEKGARGEVGESAEF